MREEKISVEINGITFIAKKKELKLADEGTIMADFQKERTDAITEMFDNKYKDGLYPTSSLFIRLDEALQKALIRQKAGFKNMIKKEIEELERKNYIIQDIEKVSYCSNTLYRILGLFNFKNK